MGFAEVSPHEWYKSDYFLLLLTSIKYLII